MSTSPANDGHAQRPDRPSRISGSGGAPAGATPGRARIPRWVAVAVILTLLAAVLVVVMLLAGHGPGRHMTAGLPGRAPATIHTAR